jgi:transcriptional regulator with XRE-family HTH domain
MPGTKTSLTYAAARDIKIRREELGLSQQDLADKVGVKRSRIKRLEAFEVGMVDSMLLERIARTLGKPKSKGSKQLPRESPNATLKTKDRTKPQLLEPYPKRMRRKLRAALEKCGLLDRTLRELLE